MCCFFMALLSLGLDSLCAPFLYLNFNNEGEYLFLQWAKKSTVSRLYLRADRCVHPLRDGKFLYLQRNFKVPVAIGQKKWLVFENCVWCTALQAGIQILFIAKYNNDI